MLEKQEQLYIIEYIVLFWLKDIIVRASGFLHAVLNYCCCDWHNSELFTFLLVWIAQLVWGFDIGGRIGVRRILFGM